MRKYCICFVRVSTVQQDLTAQAEQIHNEARKMGYDDDHQITIEFKESAIKLSADERAGIQKLKDAINKNPDIDCVICWELSRIGRRADVIYNIRDFFIEHNVQWVVMTPYMRLLDADGKMSQTSSIMLALFTSLAESEMAIKQERFKRGREHLKAQGKYYNGRVLRGYKVDKDKNFVVDESPDQAPLVRRIFNEYITGNVTVRQLAQEMVEEGYFYTKQPSSGRATIQTMIKDPRYYGEGGTHPAIISKETWDKAQQVMIDHRVIIRTPNKAEMLCKGIFVNKKTGYAMLTYATKHQYTSDADHGPTVTVKQSIMDKLIWEFASDKYKNVIMNKEVMLQTLMDANAKLSTRNQTLNEEMDSIEAKIDKVEERLIFGKISDEKADALTEQLSKQRDELYQRFIKNIETSRENLRQVRDLLFGEELDLNTLTFEQRRDIVRQVVEKILVDKPVVGGKIYHIEVICKLDQKKYVYLVDSRKVTFKLVQVTSKID